MARIRFDITAALKKWRARGTMNSRRFRMMDLQALHELPRGPGWFDSSWDLDQGLEVEVAAPGDPAFEAWLEAQSRAIATAPRRAAVTHPVAVAEMVAFEPVEWTAEPPPPDLVVDALPAWSVSELLMPDLLMPDLLVPDPKPERSGISRATVLKMEPMLKLELEPETELELAPM